ncbi:MAG: SUMF1/EgtB/PvdO family nonheme iron enzyme [Chloroflexi bacterium]|nr:SUMF1/EgtB/PvdO family nonheme iron enzyme [Chloroflexota bacterium]
MDSSQVAAEFRQLKAQYDAGTLSETDFKARLQDLMLQDEQGRWWMIGYETGQWYVHDGEKWVRAEPPMPQKKLAEEPARREEATAPKLTRSEVVAPPPARKWPVGWIVVAVGLVGLVAVITTWAAMRPGPTPITPAPTVTPALTATPRPEPTKTLTAALPTKASEPIKSSVPGIASTMVSDKDGMTLVYVPAGEFTMGAADGDSEASDNEKPQHKVYLDAYWIDRTEVTNARYRQCVAAGACQPPSASKTHTRASYYGNAEYDNYPVIYVAWDAAQKYCQWAGRRLPTEAEWEKAARGTDGRKYPWGDAAPENQRANFNNNKDDTTAVGGYPSGASPYGAVDMAGNVWEWVADWYNATYYRNAPAQNPKGPDADQYRVLRGGSWVSVQRGVRAAGRYWFAPTFVDSVIGFRCARS